MNDDKLIEAVANVLWNRLDPKREITEGREIIPHRFIEAAEAALRAVRECQQKQYDEYAMKLMDEGYQFIKTTYDEKTGAIKTEYLTKDEVFKAQPPQEGK
jgi:hypothetical protein